MLATEFGYPGPPTCNWTQPGRRARASDAQAIAAVSACDVEVARVSQAQAALMSLLPPVET
jgi:hypothetical protein